jgi:YD repeat-containing protein
LTGLKNEAGEQYSFGRDACGRIIREKGFDGVTRRVWDGNMSLPN